MRFLQTRPAADHCRDTMPATSADLFSMFDRLGIEHSTVEHPPFFTIEDGRPWHDKIPGLHGKNLFLQDRKGGIWQRTVAQNSECHSSRGLVSLLIRP
jgi:Ala-tRNA(Pro) deacylase